MLSHVKQALMQHTFEPDGNASAASKKSTTGNQPLVLFVICEQFLSSLDYSSLSNIARSNTFTEMLLDQNPYTTVFDLPIEMIKFLNVHKTLLGIDGIVVFHSKTHSNLDIGDFQVVIDVVLPYLLTNSFSNIAPHIVSLLAESLRDSNDDAIIESFGKLRAYEQLTNTSGQDMPNDVLSNISQHVVENFNQEFVDDEDE